MPEPVAVASAALVPRAGATRPAAGQFAARADLVEVYATVTDQAGRAIGGLRSEDFVIEEDGVRQDVQVFATGDAPLALAIGIDRSFSVTSEALSATVAGVGIMLGRLSADDRVMLIGIGSDAEVLTPLESDRTALRRALQSIERWGTTPLFDAVIGAIGAVQPAPGRRALILLSDGRDRYSHATAADVVTYAREHDVLVYPVSIGSTREAVWGEVAAVSGARSFYVREARGVASTLETVVDELRQQYLLGYAPRAVGLGGWRSIRVRVNRPQARVRARDGYVAPSR